MAVYRSFALIRRIEASPAKAFAAFALLHAAVWTALPALLYPNLPLDLIEALVYGREWQLGYDKLPPLPWWLAEAAYRLIGHDFAYYLLAQITVVAALAAVFAMARPLIGGVGALVAVLIIDGLHYLNYTADKFNHDVDQLPFWALAGLSCIARCAAARSGIGCCSASPSASRCGQNISSWCWRCRCWCSSIADRDARKAWRRPDPMWRSPSRSWSWRRTSSGWCATTSCRSPTPNTGAVLPRGLLDHLWHPLQFALSQLYFLLPVLLIAASALPATPIHERAAAAGRAPMPSTAASSPGWCSGRWSRCSRSPR